MVSDAAKKKAAAKKAAASARHAIAHAKAQAQAQDPKQEQATGDGAAQEVEEAVPAARTREGGGAIPSPGSSLPLPRGRVVFPPSLTPRQRALLHDLAESHGLQHASAGDDCSRSRQLAIWRTGGEGPEAQPVTACLPQHSDSKGVSDAELEQALREHLGWEVSLAALDAASRKADGAVKVPQGMGKGARLGKCEVADVRSVDDFVKRMAPLITMEKDAEVALATEAASKGSPETAQKKGRALLNLRCTDATAGLLGKTLLTLQPNRGPPLPPHKFTPHDVVALKPNKAEASKPPLGQGVVYRVRDDAIVVAVDDVPEDGLETPLRLEKLANDVTYNRLKETLVSLTRSGPKPLPGRDLIPVLFGQSQPSFAKAPPPLTPFNRGLDESQRQAVQLALSAHHFALLHGPPGTGKTTTVVEIVLQEVLKRGSKVLVCAASNVAVDNLVERLTRHKGVRAVRLGHPARLLPSVLDASLDALVQGADNSALAKDVRKEMQKLGGKLLKTKDRRERGEIRRELKRLGKEERQRQQQAVEDVIKDANVVLTTLTGALSRQIENTTFDLVVIDEAAQALEVACWSALLKGRRVLLAGDHLQLPPTVQSEVAEKRGLGVTLFERLTRLHGDAVTSMLTVQYRMHAGIMQWSSAELYSARVTAHQGVATHRLPDLPHVRLTSATEHPLVLIDTAGCSMEEAQEQEGESLRNEGEAGVAMAVVKRLMEAGVGAEEIGVISPYSAQVGHLKALKGDGPSLRPLEISTVDGFQGREKEAVIISMVRSNEKGEVGFLADARRMNVAVTRARRQCCIICDSDTVKNDAFLCRMLEYFEANGDYLSAMEFTS